MTRQAEAQSLRDRARRLREIAAGPGAASIAGDLLQMAADIEARAGELDPPPVAVEPETERS